MKFQTFLLLPSLLLLFPAFSCSKLPGEESGIDRWITDGRISINATRGESNARTVIGSDGNVLWSPNDSISVFYGICDLGKFVGINTAPTKTTEFHSTSTFDINTISGGSNAKFLGVNPYSSLNSSDSESLTLCVPAEQTAVSGTFSPGSFPSVAQSDDLNLAFYNVCGGLKFKVLNSGIRKVSFRGNNNEILAGTVKVKFDGDNRPKIIDSTSGSTQVTLFSPDGLIPGEWYFISLLPATLSKGFTIDISTQTRTVSFVSEKNTSVKRSVFGVLSDIDEGISLDQDWRQCDFLHKSLLIAIPNCSFSSVIITTEEGTISRAKQESSGKIEAMQLFANGPEPTKDISRLLSSINVVSLPYDFTDYRQKVTGTVTPYSTYLTTHELYGTTSGIALKTSISGKVLTVEASLYIKKADNYKIVAALIQDDSEYRIYTNGGANTPGVRSDGVNRGFLTDILGESLTAVSDGTVLYRSYKQEISDDIRSKLRVLVYILRPYGERQAVCDDNFGSYYVDNAISVDAGGTVELPVIKKINSEIGEFEYGGTIN